MESQEPCDICKVSDANGAYKEDPDVMDSEPEDSPSDVEKPDADKAVIEGFIDEAAIVKAVWGSDDEEDDLSESEKNEEPSKSLSRTKRAYLRMPTGKKYHIPSPKMPEDRSCTQRKVDLEPVTTESYRNRRLYKIIAKEMENTIVSHPGYTFTKYNIVKIEKVSNICLWKQYLHQQRLVKQEAGFLNQRMLFHGTTFVDNILQNGFNEQHSNTNGMFGAGIYFAKHSSKANQYVFGAAYASSCPRHKDLNCEICERKLLLCRVTLGKVKSESKAVTYANEPKGYNSVAGEPTPGGLKYPEYVIYKREQAYPQFVITYTVE